MPIKPILFLVIVSFLFATASYAQNNWLAGMSASLNQPQYHFQYDKEMNGYTAVNQQNELEFIIDASGYAVRQPSTAGNTHSFDLDFLIQSVQGKLIDINPSSKLSQPSRLVYNYQGYDVEYINNKEGLRQNFVINIKNGNSGLLQVDLRIRSSLHYTVNNGNQIIFSDDSGKVMMIYDELKVWDAAGRRLPASIKIHKDVLMLKVNDANAVYPVTIDPLNHTP